MKEEGRRKKEEGRGLYMWIGIPTQNRQTLEVGVLNRQLPDKVCQIFILTYQTSR